MKKPPNKSGIQEKKLNCPYCASKSIIKKGKRTNKFKQVHLYLCKDCNKRFTDDKFKSKTYPIATVVKALSAYNSGLTIEEVADKVNIPKSTIANWIKEYRYLFNIMYFAGKVREFSKNEKLIQGHKYIHQLVYPYLQHNFKVEKYIKPNEPKLYNYLQKARNGNIDKQIFLKSDTRASKAKLNILDLVRVKKTQNNACEFANIATELVDDNRKRHWAVEKIMLENDTSTIATEVPVYMQLSTSTIPWIKDMKSKNDYITGHIDLLQYRNKKLYILDYKPGAAKEKPLGQLFVYACCLSKSTGIHFVRMKLAWFDNENYYEVDAMDVYKTVMESFKISNRKVSKKMQIYINKTL